MNTPTETLSHKINQLMKAHTASLSGFVGSSQLDEAVKCLTDIEKVIAESKHQLAAMAERVRYTEVALSELLEGHTRTEPYIFTANATFPLSQVDGFDMSVPCGRLGGYFNGWGLRILSTQLPSIEERFPNEDDANAARDVLNAHFSGDAIIHEDQHWATQVTPDFSEKGQ